MISSNTWSTLANLLTTVRRVAVVGASNDPHKYGHTVYQRLRSLGYVPYPVNPNQTHVQGDATFPQLKHISPQPELVSVITPPEVSRTILQQAESLHLTWIWFQPGAYDDDMLKQATSMNINVIAGPCILVSLTTLKGLGRIAPR